MEIRDINWKKVRLLILIPVLIIATVIYLVSGCSSDKAKNEEIKLSQMENTNETAEEISDKSEKESDSDILDTSGDIFIDVGGAVVTPKVVKLKKGARIYEAIEAAGGKSKLAVTKYMNLAAVCEDGQKIYVPTEAEITKEEKDNVVVSSAGYTGPDSGGGTSGSSTTGKININTATGEELQSLSGIGPSMAERIIQYRTENGKFSSVDELLEVSGIGEKTLSKFVENICV